MERDLKSILNTEPTYIPPYVNHCGYGNPIGAGNKNGKGFAYINYEARENYTGTSIISFNGNKTYLINGYLLYIKNFHFPWVKGEIINNDFTTQTCYFSAINNKVAVSDSIKNVYNELKEKIDGKKYNDSDLARAFVMYHPDYEKECRWGDMLEWHALSLNSCDNGRNVFTDVCGKKKDDLVTPKEFVELIIKHSPEKKLGEEIKKLYLS